MKQNVWILIAGLLLVLSPFEADSAANRTPPGSFVRMRVASVSQLVQQVRNDPVVRKRYASHFKMSPQAITGYFSRNLKLVSLKKPLRATVWYVGKNGTIHTKTKLLPKGTQVFADKAGKPIIVWSCGNPLAKKLVEPKVEKEQVKAAPVEEVGNEPTEEVLTPPEPVKTPTTTEELLQPAPVESVIAPPDIEVIPEISVPAVEVLPTIAVGGSSSYFGTALAVSGSVPVIGSIISGNGGTKGGGGGTDGGTVVPEVPGMFIVGAGVGCLGLYKKYQLTRK